jgi:muramoyltetrapeptide carboxypeptidase LdcA involved in peptidoglycan recycling
MWPGNIKKGIVVPDTNEARLSKLMGKWYGFFSQPDEKGKKYSIKKVEVNLEKEGENITGNVQFFDKSGNTIIHKLYNGVFDGKILIIEYGNKEEYVIQKGTIVARMSASGSELKGRFIGYSPSQDGIIHGLIYFKDQRE